ncbi:M28 family peptidase [Anaeromicropila herbilytica]|uniref:Peptidase M28 domain-containing protein n=1 Tax=Anaeromicropila herbilytica TaxID=2785025 RepID=A0A7R7EL23_9FIRM|nr:M28 family peptidase [Anaeromicropila herbilytica]BCN30851.1 hypothetical protein bsdtb5_21460 [Anaeromicropila herbilytica]
MMNYVERIAMSNKEERFRNILKLLEESQLPYEVYHNKYGNHWVNNIIVPINRKNSDKRFVLSAHYDNLDGSTASNDNASGVAILIKLAQFMQKITLKNCYDIVFFDREEYEDRGSEQYIEHIGKENILGVINMDTCGFGDTIILGPEMNLSKKVFEFITKKTLEQHPLQLIKRTPGSDDRSFENENIPNLSIGIVPEEDISSILTIIDCEIDGRDPLSIIGLNPPTFVETTHNGIKDNIKYVSDSAMQIAYKFLKNLIELQNIN